MIFFERFFPYFSFKNIYIYTLISVNFLSKNHKPPKKFLTFSLNFPKIPTIHVKLSRCDNILTTAATSNLKKQNLKQNRQENKQNQWNLNDMHKHAYGPHTHLDTLIRHTNYRASATLATQIEMMMSARPLAQKTCCASAGAVIFRGPWYGNFNVIESKLVTAASIAAGGGSRCQRLYRAAVSQARAEGQFTRLASRQIASICIFGSFFMLRVRFSITSVRLRGTWAMVFGVICILRK